MEAVILPAGVFAFSHIIAWLELAERDKVKTAKKDVSRVCQLIKEYEDLCRPLDSVERGEYDAMNIEWVRLWEHPSTNFGHARTRKIQEVAEIYVRFGDSFIDEVLTFPNFPADLSQ
ncbi:hypothetical protein H0H87_011999 [Tephrocybe sp. NHM501043]|nr:hypothetical protein H0H87_011999 [Tephrocybe sp. NHM501043]